MATPAEREAAPPPPSEQPQVPPSGAGTAAKLGIASAPAAAAPVTAAAGAEFAAATAATLAALDAFYRRRTEDDGAFLYSLLRKSYPQAPLDEIQKAVAKEIDYERQFQLKARKRVERLMGEAGRITDSAEREARVRAILGMERRYVAMRQQAMADRAASAMERHYLKILSPDGAFWILSPNVKEHTLDAVAPWAAVAGPPLQGAARRWYDGELVEIEVESGARLAVTPKHPVLTLDGWVEAGLLHEGGYLVRHLGGGGGAAPHDHVHDVPAPAEEVFRALLHRPLLGRSVVPVGSEDFHGDGQDGYVDVVGADRPLREWVKPLGGEEVNQDPLVLSGDRTAQFLRERGAAAGGKAVATVAFHSPECDAGRDEAVRDGGTGKAQALAHRQHGLSALVGGDHLGGGWVDATSSPLDAEASEGGGERLAADAKLAADLAGGLAGAVAPDKIIGVRRIPYAGHVYDLQTVGHWYTADNLIVSNCLFMGGKWWPWSVLDQIHPPLHHGCPCKLLGRSEAVEMGYISPHFVPPPEGEAQRLAREGMERARRLMEEASREDIEAHFAELEAEALVEAVRGHRRPLRWARGFERGGEFRPQRGGDPGARVRRALRDLIPHAPGSLAARRHQDAMSAIRGLDASPPIGVAGVGAMTDIVRHDAANVEFIERTAAEIRGERLALRLKDVDEALAKLDPQIPPIRVGQSGDIIGLLKERGFVVVRLSSSGRGRAVTFQHDESGSQLYVVTDARGAVAKVAWAPAAMRRANREPLGRSPENLAELEQDGLAWADELAAEWGSPTTAVSVIQTPDMRDHAGNHDWSGQIRLGREADAGLGPDADPAMTYSTYEVLAHEVAHSVNGNRHGEWDNSRAVLEEGLTEEVAHVLAARRLREHGREDVLAWAAANPTNARVVGTYQGYRRKLRFLLDEAGVPEADREGLLMRWKFAVRPEDRMAAMGADLARYGGVPGWGAEEWEREVDAVVSGPVGVGSPVPVLRRPYEGQDARRWRRAGELLAMVDANPAVAEEIWRKPKKEYEAFPVHLADKAYDDYTDEDKAELHASMARGREWEHAVRHALAMGEVSIEDAVALGYRPDGHEIKDSGYGATEYAWGPLPERLYHVTTAARAVEESGRLKSRDELRAENMLNGSGDPGLGGGASDTISYTDSAATAMDIRRALLEAMAVARGDLTVEEMMRQADAGEGAPKPWGGAVRQAVNIDGVLEGVTQASRDEVLARFPEPPTHNEYLAAGWTGGHWPDDPDERPTAPVWTGMARSWSLRRPRTEAERREAAWDVYKAWAMLRQHVGGPLDPMFFGTDVDGLAAMDERDIKVVEVRPTPGAQGYKMGSLGEWRSPTGDNVRIVSIADEPLARPNVIALDGPAASGKSTLARLVADDLGGTYIDSGAFYRAAAVMALRHDSMRRATEAVRDVRREGDRWILGGEDITDEMRWPETDEMAANMGRAEVIQDAVGARLREIADSTDRPVVVDGRDAGAVMAAGTRLYVDAPVEVRAARRAADRGTDPAEMERALVERDRADIAKLEAAQRNAIRFSTEEGTPEENAARIADIVRTEMMSDANPGYDESIPHVREALRDVSPNPPTDFSSLAEAAADLSDALAATYGAQSSLLAVQAEGAPVADPIPPGVNALYNWQTHRITVAGPMANRLHGAIVRLGYLGDEPEAPRENALWDVWLPVQVLAHETHHSVNPMNIAGVLPENLAMEEALTEETSRLTAMEWLRRMGLGEVADLVASNPDAPYAKGVYAEWRAGLALTLARLGVEDPGEVRDLLFRLKFQVPPAARIALLASMLVEAGGARDDAEARALIVTDLTRGGQRAVAERAERLDPLAGFTPLLELGDPVLREAAFVEGEHPRARTGQFAEKSGGQATCVPPRGVKRRGTVLLIHGGGWSAGSPGMLKDQCARLARAGFVSVRVKYPLGNIAAAFAATRKAAAAERRKGGRVYAAGISAGGAMAVMLAGEGLVDGAYAWAPPTDLAAWSKVPGVNLKAVGAGTPERQRRYSAALNLSPERAPIFVEHVPSDSLVPFSQSEELLRRYGPRMTLKPRPDAAWGAFGGHGGDGRQAGSGTGTSMFSWLLSQSRRDLREGRFRELLHPRDRLGRWIDAPDAIPDGRDAAPRIGESERRMTVDEFDGIFDGFSHAGLTARTGANYRQTWPPAGGRAGFVVVDEDGNEAGVGYYSFQGGTAHIASVSLHPEYRGRGFFSALHERFYDRLREAGFDRVELTAMGIGSYAWASAGYEWDNPPGAIARSLIHQAEGDGRWDEIASRVAPGVLAEFRRKLLAGEFTTPMELASYGAEEPWVDPLTNRPVWLGKAFLLDGVWSGHLNL